MKTEVASFFSQARNALLEAREHQEAGNEVIVDATFLCSTIQPIFIFHNRAATTSIASFGLSS
jgi:hypothetical protein